MRDTQYIALKPPTGLTPEQARDIRARAWVFVFQCWQEKQEGGPDTAPDDAKVRFEHDSRAKDKYTRLP